jgi:hypothetical protein
LCNLFNYCASIKETNDKEYLFFLLFISSSVIRSQTTDLAIACRNSRLGGNGTNSDLSEFQYVITIINSSSLLVSNATFSQNINQNVTVIAAVSQNNVGGASLHQALIWQPTM